MPWVVGGQRPALWKNELTNTFSGDPPCKLQGAGRAVGGPDPFTLSGRDKDEQFFFGRPGSRRLCRWGNTPKLFVLCRSFPQRFPLDGDPEEVTHYAMGKHCSSSRGTARALVTGLAALAFLVQALAFVFSTSGRIAYSSGNAGAPIAMAGDICHAKPDDSGKSPAQPARHHYCTVCSIANNGQGAVDAIALAAGVVIVFAPRSDDAPTWFHLDYLSPLPVGWTSSWSSRAPPSFS